MGALHLNGITERHERDACEGCANRDTLLAAKDTRIAELEALLEDRENRLRGVNRLSRPS